MSLAIWFNFLCAQHVSEINISVLQAEACNTDTTPTQPHRISNTQRTKNNTTNVVIQQNSRKLLMMDILMSETCWAHKKWNEIASDIKLVFYSSTITMMQGPINIKWIIFTLMFYFSGRFVINFSTRTKEEYDRRKMEFDSSGKKFTPEFKHSVHRLWGAATKYSWRHS